MNYKLDNINNYLEKSKEEEFISITKEIYKLTKHLNELYPGYKDWFYNKQIKGCLKQDRNIIFVKNISGKIIAVSCLKKDNEERKICTFFVMDEYNNQGIGNILMKASIGYLETTKPLITLTEDKVLMFKKMITKYNWQLTEVLSGIYKKEKKEFCFNGYLSKKENKKQTT